MRIAVLSDTHLPSTIRHPGLLGGTLEEHLASVDLILHGGDVTEPSVLDWCEQFAPVRCSLGAHDHFEDERCAPVQYVEHAGWRIGMVHDVEAIPRGIDTPRDLARAIYGDADLDVLIAGDSHYERLEYRDGVLLLDPSSPSFPHHRTTRLGAIALLEAGAGPAARRDRPDRRDRGRAEPLHRRLRRHRAGPARRGLAGRRARRGDRLASGGARRRCGCSRSGGACNSAACYPRGAGEEA